MYAVSAPADAVPLLEGQHPEGTVRPPVATPSTLPPYLTPILPPVPSQPPHFALWESERVKPSYDGVKPGMIVPHHPDMDYVEPSYDPAVHLDLTQPAGLTTFDWEEVAEMPPVQGNGESNLAYTRSFKVLSDEGVKVLKLILRKYDALKYKTLMIPCMIRGLVYVSPFVKALNECPVLLAHLSKLAGLPLIPHYSQMQYSHTNVSLLPEGGVMTLEEAQANAKRQEAEKAAAAAAGASSASAAAAVPDERDAVIQWHTDPVPFVLILILSDLTGIEGGSLQCVKRRGHKEGFQLLAEHAGQVPPDQLLQCSYEKQGFGLLMQGIDIVHHVTAVRRAVEPRCTMVLSLMPANVHHHDRTVTSDWFKSRPQPPSAKQNERESGFGIARGRAWRHAHQLKAFVEQTPYTEDREVYLRALRDIREQLDYTIQLLDGTVVDSDDTK